MPNHADVEHIDDVLHNNGINPLNVNAFDIADQLFARFGVVSALDIADEDIVAAAR